MINNFDNVTLDSGKGNDTINNFANNVLIKYSSGNDHIYGLNKTSTLQIATGKLKSVALNSIDYFLTVGKNTITLTNVTTLDKVNIVNTKGKAVKFTVKKLNAQNNEES